MRLESIVKDDVDGWLVWWALVPGWFKSHKGLSPKSKIYTHNLPTWQVLFWCHGQEENDLDDCDQMDEWKYSRVFLAFWLYCKLLLRPMWAQIWWQSDEMGLSWDGWVRMIFMLCLVNLKLVIPYSTIHSIYSTQLTKLQFHELKTTILTTISPSTYSSSSYHWKTSDPLHSRFR